MKIIQNPYQQGTANENNTEISAYPSRAVIIKIANNNKCWQRCRGDGSLYIASGEAMNRASVEISMGELKKLEINYHMI